MLIWWNTKGIKLSVSAMIYWSAATYWETQWAAVSTWRSSINDPPQYKRPPLKIPTCNNYRIRFNRLGSCLNWEGARRNANHHERPLAVRRVDALNDSFAIDGRQAETDGPFSGFVATHSVNLSIIMKIEKQISHAYVERSDCTCLPEGSM